MPPSHDHHENFDRFHEAEGVRLEDADVGRVERARHPREERREGERHDLVVGGVDAAAFGGDLVFADREDRAPVAGLHDHVDHQAGDHHADEHVRDGRGLGDALEARGAEGEVEAEHAVNVEEHDADDLAEAEGDDREVIPLETQGGARR